MRDFETAGNMVTSSEQDQGVRRHRDGAPAVPGGAAHGRVRGVLPAEPAAPRVVQLGAQFSRRVRVHVRLRHDDPPALHQLQGEKKRLGGFALARFSRHTRSCV